MAAVPRKAQKQNENPDRKLRSLPTAVSVDEQAEDRAVLARIFECLQSLGSDDAWLLGHCSHLEKTCAIELASGELSELKGRALDTSGGLFTELFSGKDPVRMAHGSELKLLIESSAHTQHLASGSAAVYRIDLAQPGEHAIIVQWRQGSVDAERARAIGMIAELASKALSSSELSNEIEAQQLKFDSLRTEFDEGQQFHRQFSDAIRQCFWVMDLDSARPVVISENFERVWGASSAILNEGLTGFMASVFPADHDRVLAEFHLNLEGALDTELRVITPQAEVRWIWMRAFATFDSGRRLVIIADDITERKAHEESNRTREATLVNHARALAVSDVANGVAHEINNPLAIVVGRAAQIKVALKKPAIDISHIADLADKIQATSIRISEIVSSLKSLSRQSKNALFEDASFERIFAEMRDLCSEKFRTGGVELTIADCGKSMRAQANPTMVSQLLMNLLNNSYDAVSELPEKWVRLEIYDDAYSVFVAVTDSGSGVPIKIRGRIFDPFFTTKASGQGTGLGLALAAGIAAHHRGAISLDTMSLHTRFVAQFPKRQPK